MSTLGLTLTLFMTLIFTSCQVKEADGNGLFSGHVPTTNKFTLQTPTAKTYLDTETITINVSFPFDMTISGGSPRLRLTVGSTTRYAAHVPGSNPRLLSFSYTFVSGDNDTDGINVNALELNGSTITFDNAGVTTNCDVSTVQNTVFPNVKVDTAQATISSLTFVNANGQYNAGKTLSLRVTYSENVVVTGSPYFQATFGAGGTQNLTYQSGSGSNILVFSYVIGQTVYDINGYTFSNAITLNGGTIKDAAGIDASLDMSAVVAAANSASASVDVVGTYPYVLAVDTPNNGTYTASQNLDFVLEFDRNVNVTGSPYIQLTIATSPATTTRQAQYVSGAGTNLITFRYTTVPGDVDADGIAAATSITQNAGTITAVSGGTSYFQTGNNLFVMPTTTGILVNAVQPSAVTVTRNTDTTNAIFGTALDNKWIIGQDLNITVGFNTGILVGQSGGVPYIPVTIGSTVRNATYLSGGDGQTSIVFRYTIQEGDLDTDGTLGLGSIVLNGGTMTDASLTNASLTLPATGLTTTQVDGVRPTIASVVAPANNTFSTVTGNNQTNMSFTVNWSEAVNYSATAQPTIPMDVGGTATPLSYIAGNNTAAMVYRPAALTGRNDTDGVTLTSPLNPGTATIRDQAGNAANVFTFTPPTTTGVLVDTTAPTVTSVTPITANGTYALGANLDFTVTFSESVTTLVAGGYPRIPITIGSTTRYLTPTANGTATSHTFRYTIVAGETDTDGVVLGNAVTHNGTTAYARDAGWNNSTGTFTPPTTTGILVDSTAPTVSSVTRTANGTYETGDDISITITYSENVTVDTSGGTPRIALTVGSNTRYMNYASGSGTSALEFTYTLTSSDFDADGLPSSINTLALNGGTILDNGNNSVPTTFTAQNLSSIFAMFTNTRLWVQTGFVSRAKTGSPSVSNSGAVTTEACGTSTCRTFNGDDALNLTSNLNSVETVFIVFKTPAVLGNHDIFGNDIQLVDDGADFDLDTANADITLDGTNYSGTNHNTNMATGTTHVLQVDYLAPQNYPAQALIGTSFDGAIGEVIAVSGTLTNPQKAAILSYLNTKF